MMVRCVTVVVVCTIYCLLVVNALPCARTPNDALALFEQMDTEKDGDLEMDEMDKVVYSTVGEQSEFV